MKGFKVLTTEMRVFAQWKVGEWHKEEGDLKIDDGNFFYDTPENCVYAYFMGDARIFRCETGDEVIHGDPQTHPGQHTARELLLTEEVSEEEIKTYFKANTEKMITHKDWTVRAMAARYKLGLDRLVNDTEFIVRGEVAKHGYGLEKLIDDPNELVRAIVKKKLAEVGKVNSDPYEEIFNKYCEGLTEEQKELARKCTANLRGKTPELYECGLQSFVSTLKG